MPSYGKPLYEASGLGCAGSCSGYGGGPVGHDVGPSLYAAAGLGYQVSESSSGYGGGIEHKISAYQPDNVARPSDIEKYPIAIFTLEPHYFDAGVMAFTDARTKIVKQRPEFLPYGCEGIIMDHELEHVRRELYSIPQNEREINDVVAARRGLPYFPFASY